MLQSLSIKNLALIKSENIEFEKGLNIILGETGAGKSLVFEALFFGLGIKTDKSLLRSGEENMRVDILFSNLPASVVRELESLDIENDGELLISRTLNADGRSSIKINGNIATLASLKALSKCLVDTLVQHESVALLNSKNHLQMLDSFIGSEAISLKQQLADILARISELTKRIDDFGGDEHERERRKEILEYQIDEIEKAELKAGEDNEIKEKLELLDSAEKIQETLSYVLGLLSKDDKSILARLKDSSRFLTNISNIEKVSSLQERLESSRYELEDVADELENIFSSSSFDEIEYARLDARKDVLKAIKKKYGATIELVLDYYEKIKAQYDCISGSEITIEKLTKEKTALLSDAINVADKLSEIRKQNASIIKKKLIQELADLGMKGTKFEILFDKKEQPTLDGVDLVTFTFSANEGQETKKLSKTASGGEASRIMLALKNIFTSSERNKTLLFDEVDSGTSGETGNMIATKLRNISQEDQIICITHMPQVASAGHNFIKIAKETIDGQTYSNASKVSDKEISIEIAHLISGKQLTETSIKNADELRNKFA